jgi:hypothetical protein
MTLRAGSRADAFRAGGHDMVDETIVTQCPHCGNRFKAPIASAGKQATCGSCGGLFIVVEKAPQPKVYIGPRKADEDDVLSPPVRVPSYKETPIKPGVRRPVVPSRLTGAEENHGRTAIPVGASAPPYRVMRVAGEGMVGLGVLGMIAGVAVLAYALLGAQGGDQSGESWGRGMLAGRGVGVLICGMASVGLGEALRALRDMAINSFLGVNQ